MSNRQVTVAIEPAISERIRIEITYIIIYNERFAIKC